MSIQISPLASVIILGYMGKPYLDDCITSVLDQTIPRSEYEVIYADNASPDGSADYVAKNYAEIRLIRFARNYGFSEGNNRASAHARGRYLVFVNQDTVAHHKWLSEMINAMQKNPKLGACYSNQIVPLAPEFEAKERYGSVDHTYLPAVSPFGYMELHTLPFTQNPVPTLFLSGGSFIIDRYILDKLDYLFDAEYFNYAEDLDLGLRLYSLGYEVALIPTSILYHDTGTSIHKRSAKQTLHLGAVRKLNGILRNRFITYYKNMNTSEFLLYLPFMLCGAPFKARQVQWGWQSQLIGILGTIPFVFYSFLLTLKNMSSFREKRARILAKRQTSRFWLLKSLLTRYPPIWLEKS